MKESAPQIFKLKDYLPPHFKASEVELFFDIHDSHTQVTSRVHYSRVAPTPQALELDGDFFQLVSLAIDGRPLAASEYTQTEGKLTLTNPPDHFWLTTVTKFDPKMNTSLEGLYQSGDLLVTQCEAQGFRRITYFMDRPDVMARYTCEVEADKKSLPLLLSNGNRIEAKDLDNGRHRVKWADPFPKPCYLFALVAGNLGMISDTFKTASGKKVDLEIYCNHGMEERCLFAMQSLKKSMKWDEDVFGLEYDLGTYMIVVTRDFNGGAMENKGLNVFHERLVLANPQTATDSDYANIEGVVGHEYFHNWTGNRVTCRDWFQLSLKEGLTVFRDQEFSGDMSSRSVKRIDDVDGLRSVQFAEDAGPSAHPVRPESAMAVDNFFTPTIYEKGAEVIRMIQTLIGRENFKKGMKKYFELFDGQAVTCDDFVRAMELGSGKDLTQFRRWYSQAGTPQVQVETSYDAGKKIYQLRIKQSCPPTPGQKRKEPFVIPIKMALFSPTGQKLALEIEGPHMQINKSEAVLWMNEAEQTFTFKNISDKPTPSLLREFSAPVNLNWGETEADLLFLMKYDDDAFNRFESIQKLGLRNLSQLISQIQKSQALSVDGKFVEAFGSIIKDSSLDPAIRSLLLKLPSDESLTAYEKELAPEAFVQAKRFLMRSIALAHQKAFSEIFDKYHGKDTQNNEHRIIGQRRLKNAALEYLCSLENPTQNSLAYKVFKSAENMTDTMVALTILKDRPTSERTEAFQFFYDRWKNDSVVMNKWLDVQAESQTEGVIELVKKVGQDPIFSLKTPAQVYSLYRTFGNNIYAFNQPSGEGYKLMVDIIAQVDALNPQVAARLCNCFQVLAKLPENLRAKLKAEIQTLAKSTTLSPNTRELVEKAAKF